MKALIKSELDSQSPKEVWIVIKQNVAEVVWSINVQVYSDKIKDDQKIFNMLCFPIGDSTVPCGNECMCLGFDSNVFQITYKSLTYL